MSVPSAQQARTPAPSRRLIAAGIKRGAGPLIVEQPMSTADRAAHAAASHVRRTPNHLYAEARCLENQARNLADAILDGLVPDGEKPAVRAERKTLYQRIGELRAQARHIEELDRQTAADDTDDLVPNRASADQVAIWPDELARLTVSWAGRAAASYVRPRRAA